MREGLFIVGEKRRALCGGLFVQLKQGVEESVRGWRDELLDDLVRLEVRLLEVLEDFLVLL